MTRTIAAIALAAATLTASPALATEFTTVRATIKTSDIDLSTMRGMRMLDARVSTAINRLCGHKIDVPGEDRDLNLRCRAEVARQLEPKLAALHAKSQLAQR